MSKKHVEILVKAKALLGCRDDQKWFVCHAIEAACGDNHRAERELIDFVRDSISPNYTVESWLLDEHGIYVECQTRKSIAYKKALIDQMIPIVRKWK